MLRLLKLIVLFVSVQKFQRRGGQDGGPLAWPSPKGIAGLGHGCNTAPASSSRKLGLPHDRLRIS